MPPRKSRRTRSREPSPEPEVNDEVTEEVANAPLKKKSKKTSLPIPPSIKEEVISSLESSETAIVNVSDNPQGDERNGNGDWIVQGEGRPEHPLKLLIKSLPSPPLPAATVTSPPSQRFLAALTRLVGPQNLSPSLPIATNPLKYLTDLSSLPPSPSSILYTTVITETILHRAGPEISPGILYKNLLPHFPINETLWSKYLVSALQSNRDVSHALSQLLGVPDTSGEGREKKASEVFNEVWVQDVEEVVNTVAKRDIGFSPGWLSNNSVIWECYINSLQTSLSTPGIPRLGLKSTLPLKFTWDSQGNSPAAADTSEFKPSKKEIEVEFKLSQVRYTAARLAGNSRDTARWFEGFLKVPESDRRLPGGGGLWKEYILSLKRLWNSDSRFRDVSLVRERFRELMTCGCSGVEWGWSEYKIFESQVGGNEWLERMEEEERVLGGLDYEFFSTEEEEIETVKGATTKIQAWRRGVAYEMGNPERLNDETMIKTRIRHMFEEGARVLYRVPEVWAEWSAWESGLGDKTTGISSLSKVYEMAKHALPTSGLLTVGWAEGLESVGKWKEAWKVYEDFIARSPCAMGFVLLERLIVRSESDQNRRVKLARNIFARARRSLVVGQQDRTDGAENNVVIINDGEGKGLEGGKLAGGVERGEMTYHVYLAHAMIEYKVNGLIDVACRVFELGLERHKTFLQNSKYVQEYADLLLAKRDEENFRSLVGRALEAAKEQAEGDVYLARIRQRPLWDMLLKFECDTARFSGVVDKIRDVEERRMKALGENLESGIPDDAMDALVKSEGYAMRMVPNTLTRILGRVEIMLGGGKESTGGGNDKRIAVRIAGEGDEEEGGVEGALRRERERQERERANNQEGGGNDGSKQAEWLQVLIDALPRNRGHKAPIAITELALQSLLHNALPPKPDENGPAYFMDDKDDAGEGSGGGGQKRSRDDDSDDDDNDTGTDNLFRARQRKKLMEKMG
ncbi:hypothetical protein TrLO_g8881 [Triparma laevis f. longispina]|uniref:Suppressor of forked domain-containing protein n=1 Tax=Triparma laevis f. longispina TaxID=1714387 RepID=A0A9W7CC29_9STRA|nr:hypothetical protein TrLO_g8881 [Triparma laevis f. longispina]